VDGSCEYTEEIGADRRQGVTKPLWELCGVLTNIHVTKLPLLRNTNIASENSGDQNGKKADCYDRCK
jgi:hypothetical protein